MMERENGAVPEEEQVGVSTEDKIRGPAKPERVAFGQIAIDLGYVTEEQIEEALETQETLREQKEGDPPKLGSILVHKGYLTKKQVREVFRTQGRLGGHTEIEGFRLEEKIGEGSKGAVYRASKENAEQPVALKILSPKLAQDEQNIKQFIREARALAKLNHPHIVQGIDVGESNGVHYCVMEYIEGPTVKELLDQNGEMDSHRALRYIIQITKALQCAHEHQMVHRDVKPDNMMVNSEGNAKLCDLGLAHVVTEGDIRDSGLGTPNYLSPEQALRESELNIQADLYSLGASFYHMLTGRVPFIGETSKEVVRKQIESPLLPPREVNPKIDEEIDRIVRKLMKKSRSDRYNTPSDVLEDLEQVDKRFEERS